MGLAHAYPDGIGSEFPAEVEGNRFRERLNQVEALFLDQPFHRSVNMGIINRLAQIIVQPCRTGVKL